MTDWEEEQETWDSFPVHQTPVMTHAAHPITTEVPPGYDGSTNWFKCADAVEEWSRGERILFHASRTLSTILFVKFLVATFLEIQGRDLVKLFARILPHFRPRRRKISQEFRSGCFSG